MDSESEDFACVGNNDNFFDGLSQAPRLTLKEKLLLLITSLIYYNYGCFL